MHRNYLLRQRRVQHNWRQIDVADRLGVTVITIQRWERGSQRPNPYYRNKLCGLFALTAQELGLTEAPALPRSKALYGEPSSVAVSEEVVHWTVPYARNPHFTGRDDLLDQLTLQLSPTTSHQPQSIRRAALTQSQVIKGLGGIGKTQIAVEYAYRTREQGFYAHTVWINAASEEAIQMSYTVFAEMLPALHAKDETDQLELVATVIRWLEQCPQPWLLIFDNVDEFSLVHPYLPQWGNGSLLFTTRAHAIGSLASCIEVDNMGMMEGTQLLLRRAHRLVNASDEVINEASNLATALAQFPLALDQAGAYIEETGCSVSDYIQMYQQHRRALLARRGKQVMEYPESVATTWSLSFQRVEQTNPAAAELLRLCALLSPDHIPEELLIEGAPYWPPALQQAVADRFTFNQMLDALLAYSLVKRLADDRLLSIHRLVQVVQMEGMSSGEQRLWSERLVLAMHAVFPRDPENEVTSWPQCQRYLEQTQACDMLIQQYQILLPEAAEVLDRTGTYLRERGLYTLTEPLYERALHIFEQCLGGEHVKIASSLNHLAQLYHRQGKYAQAESLFLQALRMQDKLLVAKHDPAAIAILLHDLASLYRDQGRYEEAEALCKQSLHIREQLWGPEHLEVATSLNDLALLYYEQEKYEKAEPLFLQVIRIDAQQRGCEHPNMAYPLNNLANLYQRQGRYEEAEARHQQARAMRERLLGPDHLDTSQSLNNLAFLYYELGKYAEAEPLYERVLHIREQLLGLEHPKVAYVLHGLALLYAKQGRYEDAESLYERTLRIREQLLGPEHIEIANVLYDFAGLQQQRGYISEAASLYQQALTTREHMLGSDHAMTTATRVRLDEVLLVLGRMDTRQRNAELKK